MVNPLTVEQAVACCVLYISIHMPASQFSVQANEAGGAILALTQGELRELTPLACSQPASGVDFVESRFREAE